MHRTLNALCLLLSVLLMAVGSSPVRAGQPAGAAAQASSPLWKLEKDEAVLYLLGSFHLLDNVDYRDNPAFQRAFKEAVVVVFETDIAGLESPQTRQVIRSRGLYGHGSGLRSEISPSTYRLLTQTAAELGIPMENLNAFRPWLCAITVTALKYRQLGFLSENGVDSYFYRRARRAGKEVVALETPEEQISLFAGLSARVQEQMLAQTLKDLAHFDQKVGPLVEAWSSGDAGALTRILLENFREYPAVYRRLVTDRNRRWLQQLEALVQDRETVLIVVGAAHLVGPDGLMRLLEKRGYQVEKQ